MHENHLFKQGSRGCLISLLCIVLAISTLAASSNIHFSQHPACSGMLGGGFPLLFICDDWGGSSPTGSWGKIDFVDVFNGGIQPGGFLVDFLFYILLILILWFAASSALIKRIEHRELWWTTFIVLGFISGFLFAFLTVWSSDSYIKRHPVGTPTPVIPSPTALESVASTKTPTAALVP